jgi:transposase-like protein
MVVPELPDEVQRWTAKRRSALVLSILRGETSIQEAARAHGLTVGEIDAWQDRYLQAGENALRSRPREEEALREEEVRKLKQKIGELVLDNDILKEVLKPSPSARRSWED